MSLMADQHQQESPKLRVRISIRTPQSDHLRGFGIILDVRDHFSPLPQGLPELHEVQFDIALFGTRGHAHSQFLDAGEDLTRHNLWEFPLSRHTARPLEQKSTKCGQSSTMLSEVPL